MIKTGTTGWPPNWQRQIPWLFPDFSLTKWPFSLIPSTHVIRQGTLFPWLPPHSISSSCTLIVTYFVIFFPIRFYISLILKKIVFIIIQSRSICETVKCCHRHKNLLVQEDMVHQMKDVHTSRTVVEVANSLAVFSFSLFHPFSLTLRHLFA